MFDVTCIGELLIDFTQTKNADDETISFVRNPGGAPANVLTVLAKFHRRVEFIGKVGSDSFGQYLQQVLIDSGIHTHGLKFSNEVRTTLAFGLFHHGKDFVKMNSFKVKAVDTTGAGDAFLGGILHKFIEYKVHPSLLKVCEVVEMAMFANTVASLSVTKNGGIPCMPTLDEVDDLLYLEGRK